MQANEIFKTETWIGTYAILIKIYSTNGNIIVQLKIKQETNAPHLSVPSKNQASVNLSLNQHSIKIERTDG